jgi:hypothetical protein
VESANLSIQLRSKWANLLKANTITPHMLQSMSKEAAKKIQRLERMFHSSGSLSYEEAMLLVTERVELEMLLSYLHRHGVAELPTTALIDDALHGTILSPTDSIAFRKAQRTARMRWGLPLRSRWLGTE